MKVLDKVGSARRKSIEPWYAVIAWLMTFELHEQKRKRGTSTARRCSSCRMMFVVLSHEHDAKMPIIVNIVTAAGDVRIHMKGTRIPPEELAKVIYDLPAVLTARYSTCVLVKKVQ